MLISWLEPTSTSHTKTHQVCFPYIASYLLKIGWSRKTITTPTLISNLFKVPFHFVSTRFRYTLEEREKKCIFNEQMQRCILYFTSIWYSMCLFRRLYLYLFVQVDFSELICGLSTAYTLCCLKEQHKIWLKNRKRNEINLERHNALQAYPANRMWWL